MKSVWSFAYFECPTGYNFYIVFLSLEIDFVLEKSAYPDKRRIMWHLCVSMIRKQHNHTLHTDLRHREEEPHNIYITVTRHL